MRNAITASKYANCVDFTGSNDIIPIFHTRKHKKSTTNEDSEQASASNNDSSDIFSMCEQLNEVGHSEYTSNVLFYIAGYIVSKLIKTLACAACKKSLLPLPKQLPTNGHDYTSTIYHEAGKASSFTTFINKGGLQIPSTSNKGEFRSRPISAFVYILALSQSERVNREIYKQIHAVTSQLRCKCIFNIFS